LIPDACPDSEGEGLDAGRMECWKNGWNIKCHKTKSYCNLQIINIRHLSDERKYF